MKKIEANIPGVWIIEPQVFGDHAWNIVARQRCGVKGYLLPSPK